MNPQSLLVAAYQAIAIGRYAAAHTHILEYQLWRSSGGAEPKNVNGSLMSGDHFVMFCEHEIRSAMRDALRRRFDLVAA